MTILATHEQLELIGEDGDYHCYFCGREMSYQFDILDKDSGSILGPTCLKCIHSIGGLFVKYLKKVGTL